jgi:hypothetical protein
VLIAMPILHEWNAPNGVLRTVLIGPVGFEEIYRHLDEVAEANAFPRAELIDARATDGPPPSFSELRRLAAHARDLMGGAKPGPRAIVIDPSPLNKLAVELFCVFMSGPMNIDFFTSEAEARRWLRDRLQGVATDRADRRDEDSTLFA